MRTTYISQDSDAVRKPGYNEKTAKAMREVRGMGVRIQIYGVTSHAPCQRHLRLTPLPSPLSPLPSPLCPLPPRTHLPVLGRAFWTAEAKATVPPPTAPVLRHPSLPAICPVPSSRLRAQITPPPPPTPFLPPSLPPALSPLQAAAAGNVDDGPASGLEAQIAAIEAAFEAAQRPPVHRTNPKLHAVEVMPGGGGWPRWRGR